MRKLGKITAFMPEVTKPSQKEGQDDLHLRRVVIDCSRFDDNTGEKVTEVYAADSFKPLTDEQLQAWKDSGELLACYITFTAARTDEGSWYQRVKLNNINTINA